MAKKRIIYQTEALYVGTTGQASPDQLYRIQSASHDVDIQYVDINEMGRLSRLTTEIVEAPVVSLDFSYYILDGKNEKTFGFSVPDKFEPEVSIISGFASNIEAEEKNYYLLTVPEGKDASDGSSSYGIGNGLVGIGNGYITSYQAEASVGEIPTATVSVEATNIRFDTDSNSVPNPGINTENGEPISHDITIPVSTTGDLSAAALRPGDVVMSFGGENLEYGGAILPGMDSADSPQTGSACIQSFSLDVPLSRTPMLCLTNFYPITRNIDFPVRSTLSVNANISSISSGSLNDLICNPEKARDITITMYNKCREDTSIIYKFKNATLDSQSMSSALDTDKTVDLTFSTELDYSQPNVCINGTIVDPPTTTSTPTTTTTSTPTSTSTSTSASTPTSTTTCVPCAAADNARGGSLYEDEYFNYFVITENDGVNQDLQHLVLRNSVSYADPDVNRWGGVCRDLDLCTTNSNQCCAEWWESGYLSNNPSWSISSNQFPVGGPSYYYFSIMGSGSQYVKSDGTSSGIATGVYTKDSALTSGPNSVTVTTGNSAMDPLYGREYPYIGPTGEFGTALPTYYRLSSAGFNASVCSLELDTSTDLKFHMSAAHGEGNTNDYLDIGHELCSGLSTAGCGTKIPVGHYALWGRAQEWRSEGFDPIDGDHPKCIVTVDANGIVTNYIMCDAF